MTSGPTPAAASRALRVALQQAISCMTADVLIWQSRTIGYHYALDDAHDREIVVYHWHPRGRSHATKPHLHLGAGAGTLRPELTKAYLATGPVTPVVLLALLLEQFAVWPRRADWPAVLERARQALEAS